jgi:hypothetical protein
MEFLHMPKELNDLSDQVIVTLIPNKKEFPSNCGQERSNTTNYPINGCNEEGMGGMRPN